MPALTRYRERRRYNALQERVLALFANPRVPARIAAGALAALQQQLGPQRFSSLALRDAVETPPRKRFLPAYPEEQEREMPRGFPQTGSGGTSSVSYYTDKLKSNARELAKLSLDTGKFQNLDNGSAVYNGQYGDLAYTTLAFGMHRSELEQYFTQAINKDGLVDTQQNTRTMKIYIKDFYMHIDVVNATNTTMYLELLDIRPRHNIVSAYKPDVYVANGLNDASSSGDPSGLMMTDMYLSHPFVTHFNVYKTTKIILDPGEWHTHRVHFSPNMLLDRSVVQALANDPTNAPPPYYFERLSYFCMARWHGAPVIATDSEGGDFCTYSKTKLGVCWHSRAEYTIGFPLTDDLYFTDNLNTVATGAETILPNGQVAAVDQMDP